MSVVRQYLLHIRTGQDDTALDILTALSGALASIEGFEGADLWQDADHPSFYVFNERWRSREVHTAGARHVPKELMSSLASTLCDSPQGRFLVPIGK